MHTFYAVCMQSLRHSTYDTSHTAYNHISHTHVKCDMTNHLDMEKDKDKETIRRSIVSTRMCVCLFCISYLPVLNIFLNSSTHPASTMNG